MQRHEEFVGLLVTHQQSLYSYIRTLVTQHADAEDVLQQVSIVLWRKFESFEAGSDFLAWACRVAHFEVLNFRKSQRNDAVSFSSEFLESLAAEWSSRSDLLAEERAAIEECVAGLKPADRKLITLCYDGSHTTVEVAAEVNRSAESVYVSLSRIRRNLLACVRRVLRREGVE